MKLSVATWLDQLPLETLKRLAHSVLPLFVGYTFAPRQSSGKNFQTFVWEKAYPTHTTSSLVVAFQPPW